MPQKYSYSRLVNQHNQGLYFKLVIITGNDIDGGLKFTKDGSLEITEVGTGNSLWTNRVSGGEMLFLQNDGNLVMYDIQERNIWETGTGLAYCEKGNCII